MTRRTVFSSNGMFCLGDERLVSDLIKTRTEFFIRDTFFLCAGCLLYLASAP